MVGVVNHFGSNFFGHYTAFCKVGDKWFDFDDSTVSEIPVKNIVSKDAYTLIYVRCEPGEVVDGIQESTFDFKQQKPQEAPAQEENNIPSKSIDFDFI